MPDKIVYQASKDADFDHMGPPYEVPDEPVYNPVILSITTQTPVHAAITNRQMQAVVSNIHSIKRITDSFDCGYFDEAEQVLLHDESPAAHRAMTVDGNAVTPTQAVSLETHMTDPAAHQNLALDGNEH